jgi:omega-6 fatty acid desaturase (delta-12 desaturase)
VLLPIYFIATWIGGWLFFVQHQFEETHWDGADEWDMKIAALKGSSFLVMPKVLNWFSCNIALHHIHHLCSRIPNYRLQECLRGIRARNRLTSPHHLAGPEIVRLAYGMKPRGG